MQDILNSRVAIESLITKEAMKGIRRDRIILGGFGQGGAIALATGIASKYKLGGIFAFSTCLPIQEELKQVTSTREAF